jgi:hypothetical protein
MQPQPHLLDVALTPCLRPTSQRRALVSRYHFDFLKHENIPWADYFILRFLARQTLALTLR